MSAKPGEMALMMASQRLNEEPASAQACLLAQAKTGDARAFEEIMIQHERQVLMTAWRLLGHLHDAQDAAQEVFLRLYKYLNRFDETRRLSPWLYRMTVNVCRDMVRKRQSAAVLSLEEIPDEEIPDPVDSQEMISLAQQRRMMAEGLKRLSEKERAALVLRDIEGLSTKEVARVLGSSEMTVRSQVSRARVKMKKFIDRALRREI
ncbi:MAG: RNA polymerase sigma factor [Acidobacteria bacterium]|nr:RNA polymerase sigma factor [Acidobacteriota bacterium]